MRSIVWELIFAILASGTATGNNKIIIGGNLTDQPNSFRNIYSAIEINNYWKADVSYNTILNTSTIPVSATFGFGKGGIKITPSLNNTLNITNNTIGNCATGVWINRSLNGINTTATFVDNNTISANASGYCANGIAITDAINTGSTTAIDKIKVRNNSVTQAFNCISATNVKNGLIIYQNPTLVVRNDGINLGNGILLQNCMLVRVHNNPNITVSPLTSPVTATNPNYKGIQVITSPQSWISCNKIFNMGESMTYVGNCTNSSVFNNEMSGGNRALVLRSNGDIGFQLSSTNPCGNYWSLPVSTFAFQTYTDVSTTANSNSKLYVNSNVPAGFTGVPTLNNGSGAAITYYSIPLGGIVPISNTYLPIPCASIVIFLAPAPGGTPSLAQLQSQATDNNSYPVYEQGNRFNRKKYAFDYIDASGGTAADTSVILNNFYDSTQIASLGILTNADKAIMLDDAPLAVTDNSSVTASNIMEQNQKLFNSLYLLSVDNEAYVYTSSEKADLYSIANQCPLEGGNAVWQARVLVWTIENNLFEFPDNCSQTPKSMSSNNPTLSANTTNSDFKIYPNPSKGSMVLEYRLAEGDKGTIGIFDLTGRLIDQYPINSKNTSLTINENELSNGTYFYTIRVNDKEIKTEKLVIIK